MEQNDKNKWVEDALSSLDGLQKAEPNAFLFTRIESKLSMPFEKARLIPFGRVYLAAAAVLLLVLLNLFMLLSRQESKQDNNMQSIASYYQLTNNNAIYGL